MRRGRNPGNPAARYHADRRRYALSEHVHHGFAQAVNREYRLLAGGDGNRRNEAASDDDHAGVEIAAALGDMVGEPGQRRAGILGATFADKLAVEREAAGNADEIIDGYRFACPNHDAAIPAIL